MKNSVITQTLDLSLTAKTLLTYCLLMFSAQGSTSLTHTTSSFHPSVIDLEPFRQNIRLNSTPVLSYDAELTLLDEIAESPLGRFLLKNKGLNGYWTAYLILLWR